MMKHDSTILIVDDQLSAREVLRGLLTNQGYELAFASNGKEALAKAAEISPDLILLDAMMPELTGFEVCQRLRADPILAEVPVIIVTALDDEASLIQGIEAGADDFISKPFNPAELQARVRTTTRLNRYRRLLSGRAKFEWAVEQANDGFLVLDNEDYILYANAQARLFLDLPTDANEPILPTFLDLVRRRYNYEPEEAWVIWPNEGASVPVRYLVQPVSPTANAFWLQVNILKLPSGPDGDWIIHLQDVTAQMALQRDMWKFQSLVSHELRTPIAGLQGSLHLLQNEEVTKFLNPDMTKLFEILRRSTQRLKKNVEEILHYISTPALAQPGTEFNLSRFNEVVAQISTALELESVAVFIPHELSIEQLPLSAQAVKLIMQEILENAKKFHPQQAPTVEISGTILNGNQVRLKVSDDGLTLSSGQLAQVWTPYYQGEKYFTSQTAGMGLGLSSVALLIWGVGGTCRIRNKEIGPGVVLELIIPLSKNDAKANE